MQNSHLIECLEEKIVPAGVVSVTYAGTGALTITGDVADNTITITGAPGQLTLTDGLGSGTLFSVNGAPAVAAPVINLTNGLTTGTINLAGGSDTLQINNVTFSGNLTATDSVAGGNENVSVASVTAAGVIIDMGDGDNTLTQTGGNFTANTFRWGPYSGGSAGNDTLNFSGTSLGVSSTHGFVINLGNGTNVVNFNSGTVSLGFGISAINGGTGNDSVTIGGTSLACSGILTLALADGNNTTSITTGTLTGGGLQYTSGTGVDSFTILGTSATLGAFNLNTGAGNDEVSLGGGSLTTTNSHGFTVNLGEGTNTLGFAGAVSLAGGISSVIGGSGNDTVNIAVTRMGNVGTFSLALSDGANTTNITSGTLSSNLLQYTGGTGSDSININGATVNLGLLNFNVGAGDDIVNLAGPSLTTTSPHGFTINLGEGTNSLSFGGAVSLGGGTSNIVGGTGNDTVSIGGTSFSYGGSFSLSLSDGTNTANITTSVLTGTALSSQFGYTGGSGLDSLTITGSSVTVQAFSAVLGAGDDTVNFGGSLLKTLASNGFTVNLGEGTNALNFNSGAFELSGGTSSIVGGTGQDAVTMLSAVTAFSNTGTTSIALGAGSNSTILDAASLTIPVLNYTGTTGTDLLRVRGTTATFGSLTINAGSGENEFALWSTTTNVNTFIQYTGGAGSDIVEIGDFENGGTTLTIGTLVNVQMGDGANALGVLGATINGNLTANSTLTRRLMADVVRVYQSSVLGTTTITMGSGSSIVDLQSVSMRGTTINTGAGGDVVFLDNNSSIAGGSTYNGALSIDLGSGDDFLYAGSYPNDVNASNVFNGAVSINGGTGADTVLIQNPATPLGATRNNTFNAGSTITNAEVLG
jgi:hypothetical protein